MLIFVTGGVRSGKSSWAEHYLTVKKNQANRLVYIATSFPSDEEMTKRILQHQLKRAQGKEKWLAIEQTNDVGKLSKKLQKNDFVLLDCLTTLLTNELFFMNNMVNDGRPLLFANMCWKKSSVIYLSCKKAASYFASSPMRSTGNFQRGQMQCSNMFAFSAISINKSLNVRIWRSEWNSAFQLL